MDLTKLSKLKDCASGRSGETLANGKVSITLLTAEAFWASCRALESKAPLTCRPWGGGMVMRCDEFGQGHHLQILQDELVIASLEMF